MPTIKKRGYAAKKHQQEQQILTLAHKISDLGVLHAKTILIVTSAVAVVLLIAGIYALTRSMQEQKAAPLLAGAYESYGTGTGSTPNYSKALDLFRDVNKKYPSTKSGAIAQYYVGNSLMNLGRNDEALKEYQLFVSRYGGQTFVLGLVYERMGYLYAGIGKQEDAIKSFEKSESLMGPGLSTVELAKLYEAAGNSAESQKKYKLISDNLAGTKFAMEATGKVQKIDKPAGPDPAKNSK